MTETADTGAGTEVATDGGPCQCAPCLKRAQERQVRAGRWITEHSDLTKPPAPLIRWVLLLILGLCCWAAQIPLDFKDWLGPIIIAGALILPDVAGFGVAGVRLDLKQAQDAIATLRQEVNAQARASSAATLAFGDSAIAALFQPLKRVATQVADAQATGAAEPWDPGAMDAEPEQDIAS